MVESGSPAFFTACRAGACPNPAETTFPRYASVTLRSLGRLSRAPLMAVAPNSVADTDAKEPLNFVIGVLAMDTMTTLVMEGRF